MENSRYLDCLSADFRRLREVAQRDPAAAVPTCPGWSAADLTRHVGQVYLHKTIAMRKGAEPDQWPPQDIEDAEPLALLDRAYAELLAEFATRKPEEPSGTWYGPDQTVGFWIRRMAQETVIHRIDAELAAGEPVAPIPDDLAIDGIDELLRVFVAFSVSDWGQYFTDILAKSPGHTFEVRAGDASWRVRTGPGLFEVEDGKGGGAHRADETEDAPEVAVSGPPAAVLRWVWNREVPGEPGGVTVEGPREALDELKRCIVTATQ